MRLLSYKDDLLLRLQDPEYALIYLEEVIALEDIPAFLIALMDVVEAGGGVGALAGHVNIQRPSLYKILSKSGNPRLSTLQQILKPLGLKLSISALEEVKSERKRGVREFKSKKYKDHEKVSVRKAFQGTARKARGRKKVARKKTWVA